MAAPAGYSGTPLVKKLGIGPEMSVTLLGAPPGFDRTLGPLPAGVTVRHRLLGHTDVAVLFATTRGVLERRVEALRAAIAPAGAAWVAWPKKASKVPTDMDENVVREVCLPIGLVDTKVCAIDEVWSGLKVVIRRELR
jgi:hypothetical protein